MDAYRERMLEARGGRKRRKASPERAAKSDGDATPDNGEGRLEQRRRNAEMRSQLAPLRQRMQQAERDVEKAQAEIARLDADLADPELYASESAKAQDLMRKRGVLAKRLEELELHWLQATDAYETASTAV